MSLLDSLPNIVRYIENNLFRWGELAREELGQRVNGKRIEEVFLKKVEHPWYKFQTLLRLDNGTIIQIPPVGGGIGPICADHIQDQSEIEHRLRRAESDEEREFFERALEKK